MINQILQSGMITGIIHRYKLNQLRSIKYHWHEHLQLNRKLNCKQDHWH